MKIAIFHNLPIGGAKRVVFQQIQALKNKGNTIDLYEMKDTDESFLNLRPFVNNRYTYEFSLSHKKGFLNRINSDYKNFITLKGIHKKIAQDINQNNYDVVLVHPDKYTQAPFLLQYVNQKSIYYCEEYLRIAYENIFGIDESLPIYKKWYEQITRTIRKAIDQKNSKSASVIFANSTQTQKNIKRVYKINSKVSYPGVNVHLFKPLKKKKIYDVLFIGEKEYYEGYPLLISALKKLSYSVRVYNPVRKGEKLSFSDKEIVNIYNSSKVVVALNYLEPFGFIPLEAMACGVPVIAVNDGGFSESIVNNTTGFLISHKSAELAHALDKLLKNSSLRIKMGRMGREYVLKYWSEEKRMKEFLSLLENV